ncbi:CinA family protein [Brevundimonas sp. NPDC092305]|uniref:CinA family protein n=1 Tax=Brevundimonas sp. NPDC092305 TaxID=3363957 RepID=UPI0038247FE4
MFPEDIQIVARSIVESASQRGIMLACAESCTGGLLAAALTEIPGSSAVVDRGFVTYSNEAKMEMLGVPKDLLDAHGAVSEEVARAMAEGVLAQSNAVAAVSVTGIAGPGGGSALKPVGLVHFAVVGPAGVGHVERRFEDRGREAIRMEAVRQALGLLLDQVTG